ncbi:MAG: glycerol-3-phosphate acyltransferase [Pedosphaera sp.]|nr:glycerol-3-phosphate acyltransferase [Pedosphaera sp.]
MAWLEQFRALDWGQAGLIALGAYILGCFTIGYYLVRAIKGVDIRTIESGSVGARNVSRVLGKTGFFLTTVGDVAKGAFAVWGAQRVAHDPSVTAMALLAVVAGHIWPAQLRFHGGKGVATSLGALGIYDWRLLLVYGALFACGLAVVRKTILPGLFAFACLPAAVFGFEHDWTKAGALGLLAAMVLFAHRANLMQEIPALANRWREFTKANHPKL